MSKGQRILNIILIIMIAILATGTGFFYSKSTALESQIKGSGTSSTGSSQAAAASTDSATDPSLNTPLDSLDSTLSPTPTPTTSTKATTTAVVKTTPKPSTTPTPKLTAGTAGTYTVKSGDTMSTIASGLGVNWLDLAKANGLDASTANTIKIGQVLKVPTK